MEKYPFPFMFCSIDEKNFFVYSNVVTADERAVRLFVFSKGKYNLCSH